MPFLSSEDRQDLSGQQAVTWDMASDELALH